MAAKRKAKAKVKAAAGGGVKLDARVQVLHGDFGNARGTVKSFGGAGSVAHVLLDNEGSHGEPRAFTLSNLRAL